MLGDACCEVVVTVMGGNLPWNGVGREDILESMCVNRVDRYQSRYPDLVLRW